MAAIRYNTFLIRHWHLPNQRDRIEIQHIQSGATGRLDSLGAILDWMAASDEWQQGNRAEQHTPEEAAHGHDPPSNG